MITDSSPTLTDSIVDSAEVLDLNIDNIRPDDIPVFISESFDLLNDLDNRIKQASTSAENAQNIASSAYSKDTGIWNRKDAIEALQVSGQDTASALGDIVDAQKLLFELHGKTAKVIKCLFALGVRSIALNRSVVRELEARLSGASKEKLSDLAKAEIFSVIRQLKAQEDIMLKQDSMNGVLKEHDDKIHLLNETTSRFEIELKEQSIAVLKIEKEMSEQAKFNVRLNLKTDEHTKAIEEHRMLLEELAMSVITRLDENIAKLTKDYKHLTQLANKQSQTNRLLTTELENHSKSITQMKESIGQYIEEDKLFQQQIGKQVETIKQLDVGLSELSKIITQTDEKTNSLAQTIEQHENNIKVLEPVFKNDEAM